MQLSRHLRASPARALRQGWALLLALGCWVSAAPVTADVPNLPPAPPGAQMRYALVIGANQGHRSQEPLRHAHRDARRLADVLVTSGGFWEENTVVLQQPDPQRLRDALRHLNGRIRDERDRRDSSVLLFFFSGHADPNGIQLGSDQVTWDELRETILSSSADLRVMVLDACRSGRATRVKGVRPLGLASLPFDGEPSPEGFAVLSSATESEDAQESDDLKASFFTHHLLAALQGAADNNDDGFVSLSEAYRYTAERTVSDTMASRSGVQHPTYEYALKGRVDLLVTRPASWTQAASARLETRGRYLFLAPDGSGTVRMEFHPARENARVRMPPGRYLVKLRTASALFEGTVSLTTAQETALTASALRRVQFAELVRKGGPASVAFSAALFGRYMAPVLSLGGGGGAQFTLAADLRDMSVDLALGVHRSEFIPAAPASNGAAAPVGQQLDEYVIRAGGRKSWDVGEVALALGFRAGAVIGVQTFSDDPLGLAPSRQRVSPVFGPTALAQLRIAGRWFAAAELELMVASFDQASVAQARDRQVAIRPALALGLGTHF